MADNFLLFRLETSSVSLNENRLPALAVSGNWHTFKGSVS